jgi:hypothetical protein
MAVAVTLTSRELCDALELVGCALEKHPKCKRSWHRINSRLGSRWFRFISLGLRCLPPFDRRQWVFEAPLSEIIVGHASFAKLANPPTVKLRILPPHPLRANAVATNATRHRGCEHKAQQMQTKAHQRSGGLGLEPKSMPQAFTP